MTLEGVNSDARRIGNTVSVPIPGVSAAGHVNAVPADLAEDELKTWERIEKTHTQEQVLMLRKLGKEGPTAFKRAKSAEAAPIGRSKANVVRFKPRRTS